MSAEVLTTLSTAVGMLIAFSSGFSWMIHRMDQAIDGVRSELKAEIAPVKGEIAELRAEVVKVQVAVARLEGLIEGRAESAPAAG